MMRACGTSGVMVAERAICSLPGPPVTSIGAGRTTSNCVDASDLWPDSPGGVRIYSEIVKQGEECDAIARLGSTDHRGVARVGP